MTDIYTVVFTQMFDGQVDSIPWQFTFADLDLAKSHVLEEAAASLREDAAPRLEWEDYEEYSTYLREYDEDNTDTWLIVRTELIENPPSPELSPI